MPPKRIYRNQREKVIGGVAAGIADYFDIDVAWVRLAFVVGVFLNGIGLLAYIVAWIVFPRDERSAAQIRDDRAAPQAPADAPPPASPAARRSATGSRNAAGIILILLGLFFFLDMNFYWFSFGEYWPLILVGLGVYLIARSIRPEEEPGRSAAPVVASGAAPRGDADGPSDHA
jgi:phage shock protein PspC (stress-responsive transcriptional regulator)